MRIAFKKGKWFVAFKETVLVCDINHVGDRYIVSYESKCKRVTLHTRNLDETFKVLEGIYDRNSMAKGY